VWLTAFICTLFLGAELGLGISIGLALMMVILESAFPHTAVLGQIERTTVYRCVRGVVLRYACAAERLVQPLRWSVSTHH